MGNMSNNKSGLKDYLKTLSANLSMDLRDMGAPGCGDPGLGITRNRHG